MKAYWIIFALLLSIPVAVGQNSQRCTIRADVLYASGGHAPAQLAVRLVKGINGTTVAMAYTNTLGTAEFSDLDPGQYQIVVSGNGFETASSGAIDVNDWNIFQSATVVIKPLASNNAQGQSTIEATDLNVPPKAAKEYNRGNEEMSRKQWEKAVEHFNKAIEIYPQFSAAYNNLAVVFGQLGQRERQRETLQKLLGFNDRCVPALVNLSDLEMEDRNYSAVGPLLDKALKLDPTNVEALFYLAQLDLVQGQYDLAEATAHKVHGLQHKNFSTVHFTAASAYEHQGRTNEAIMELQTFLQESPQGPNAEAARKAIAGLQKTLEQRSSLP